MKDADFEAYLNEWQADADAAGDPETYPEVQTFTQTVAGFSEDWRYILSDGDFHTQTSEE